VLAGQASSSNTPFELLQHALAECVVLGTGGDT
jgi:hypothetical protein